MLKLIRNVFVASVLSLVFTLSHAAPVDINTVDAATLAQAVNGIGPSKAKAIVDYRTANGRFASVDDLVNVQGIGFKTLDRIREFVTISATPAGAQVDTATAQEGALVQPATSAGSEQAPAVNQ